ncbi:calcineurin-like phosphoesterase superfamily domain protein [Rhodococcus sp. Br-6]|nr:calcineurin-like phosphoesterase superfamily domain protein [Rhodococcus sp. Br-6]
MTASDPALIAVAGDWDGKIDWARRAIAAVAARGARRLFHAGDFGIWPSDRGTDYLRMVDEACIEHDVTIYATPGNHESWPVILGAPWQARDDVGAVAWFGERIAVLPRGHRFEIAGRTFVSLGGAPSINYELCTRGVDWFPEEMITEDDVARVIAGGPADILLTHDSPDAPWQTPAVAGICANNPGGWPAKVRAYATIGRRRISETFTAVQPRLLVHGHYHVTDETVVDLPDRRRGRCRIVSLDCEWTSGNLRFVDLRTLEVSSE